MGLPELTFLSVAIAANNLVVSVGLGSMGKAYLWKRIVLVFGFFEFCIPLVGLLIGKMLISFLAESADLVSAIIIISMGIFLIWSAFKEEQDFGKIAKQITRWKGLVVLAAGLSVDNLAIGLGLGLGDAHPLLIAGMISVFSMTFSFFGLQLGRLGVSISRRWTARTAGAILIVLGALQFYGIF